MKRELIKRLALECGFSLNSQQDGTQDLHEAVYVFADTLTNLAVKNYHFQGRPVDMALADAIFLLVLSGQGVMECEHAMSLLYGVHGVLKAHSTTEELDKQLTKELIGYFELPCTQPATTTETDLVNHPSHYNSHPSGVEAIEITRHMGFNLGNAMKYLWRNGLKDGSPAIQDLEKAVWYIQDEIKRVKSA